MNKPQKLELNPGVWIDSRRALFLEDYRLLCIADLHLGYHWAHRVTGQLMPVTEEDAAERVQDLCSTYAPERLVVLGDVVHRAVPNPQIREELMNFLQRISACTRVELVAGNHDRGLASILPSNVPLLSNIEAGKYLLAHGDTPLTAISARVIVMGHEHPAVRLGDGIRHAKFPCYLAGPQLIVLPAFSNWAAGSEVGRGVYLTELVRRADLRTAVAIMGDRLLPIPLTALQRSGGEREIRTPGGV